LTTAEAPEVSLTLELRGGNRELFAARDAEILAEGPAGTGKTRTILEMINLIGHRYPGVRVLFVRKHAVTLTTTALVTFDTKVLHNGDGVRFFGGNQHEPAQYRYRNGSVIVVGGMGNANEREKILSSEYDLIYCNEATELSLDDWETLSTRLRNGVLPNPRIIGDCNPTFGKHWLMQRTDSGQTRLIRSQLTDNPAYYERDGTPTAEGAQYIARLDRLTGTRYERFRLGLRVGVENAIYPFFDRDLHVQPLPPNTTWRDGALGIDYGATHKCGIVAVKVDQFNRRWVVEAWGEPDTDQGFSLDLKIAQFKERHFIRRGRTDPNQDYLAGVHGFNVARKGEYREARIETAEKYWNLYSGGRVPLPWEERNLSVPRGPFEEPDSPGLMLVAGAPGIDALADEIEGYHRVLVENERVKKLEVVRIDDDLVAGMEYALEELETKPVEAPTRTQMQRSGPRRTRPNGWRTV
jgi:hypothetical protein